MAQTISAKDLKARKQEFAIIDVRESDELAQGVIEGSTHMPLGAVIRNANFLQTLLTHVILLYTL